MRVTDLSVIGWSIVQHAIEAFAAAVSNPSCSPICLHPDAAEAQLLQCQMGMPHTAPLHTCRLRMGLTIPAVVMADYKLLGAS